MGLFSSEQPVEDVQDVVEVVEISEEPETVEEPIEAPEPVAAPETVVVVDDEDAPLIGGTGGAFIDILEPVEG